MGRPFVWDEDPWLLLLQPLDRAPRSFLMKGGMKILREWSGYLADRKKYISKYQINVGTSRR